MTSCQLSPMTCVLIVYCGLNSPGLDVGWQTSQYPKSGVPISSYLHSHCDVVHFYTASNAEYTCGISAVPAVLQVLVRIEGPK